MRDVFGEMNCTLGNGKQRRKVGNNTYLERRPDWAIALVLHGTDVVTAYASGAVVLHDGGYKTVTTKDRMNRYVKVYQDRGRWYVVHDGITYQYKAGMILYSDGTVEGAATQDDEKAIEHTRKLITQYSKLVARSLPLELPSGGDCWYCAMRTIDGVPLGEHTGNTEHLLEHMREGYVVPSLVARAIELYGAPGWYSAAFGDNPSEWGRESVARFVRRYLAHLLDVGEMR